MSTTASKSDTLYHQVRQDILTLGLAPGEALRLPVLSERYGIGVTPLRECLNRLAAEKLVVPEHNKGFRVAPLSRDDLLDLERSRSVIEGSLFATSVTDGDDAWEATVVGAFHHLSKTPVPSVLQETDALTLWGKRHAAFHAALIAAAASTWMRRFCDQLGDQLGRYHLFIEKGLRDLSQSHPDKATKAAQVFSTAMELAPHQALYDLALSRDAADAQALFQQHANLSIRAFEDLMALMPDDSQVAVTLQQEATL